MLKLKPSKLIQCLAVAAFVGAVGLETASAAQVYPLNRSVRDMMERRREGLPLNTEKSLRTEQITISKTPRGRLRRIVRPRTTCSRTLIASGQSCNANQVAPQAEMAETWQTAVTVPAEPIVTETEQVFVQTIEVEPAPLFAPMPEAPVVAAQAEPYEVSPETVKPKKDKDGSLFPGGSCHNCRKSGALIETEPCSGCQSGPLIDTGPCEKCPEVAVVEPACTECAVPSCCDMAPLYLEHVDFNLGDNLNAAQNRIGNYRFRIFGCRRYDRDAILNQGRILQSNINFGQVFEQATQDCYKNVKLPDDLCLQTTPSPLPEYLLTAEINNVYMSVCDGYDWDNAAAQNARSGAAEISVKWRLTNLTRDKVLWEGSTTGYSDLRTGTAQGEIKLIEDAFADAVSNLRVMPGFEEQLLVRLTPEELTAQRQALIDEEVALDPAKCHYTPSYENCSQPAVQECVKVDDSWSETVAVEAMCIVDRPPYATLDAPSLYKVRASVVEINGVGNQKGAGLIISEAFVLTSANLVGTSNDTLNIRTINGKELTGRAVRVNPSKNTALVKLDTPTEYMPLSLNLELPQVNKGNFMVLGLLDVDSFKNGENFIDNSGKVTGYRYSEDKGSEIMLDTDVQTMTIGGVLIDEHGTINGIAHTGEKTENGKDLFLPTETALRSVGLSICEKLYDKPSPWEKTVTSVILESKPVAPEAMPVKDRK